DNRGSWVSTDDLRVGFTHHFRVVDQPGVIVWWLKSKCRIHSLLRVARAESATRAGGTWREMAPPTPPLAPSSWTKPCSEIETQAQLDLTRIVRLGSKHAKCLRALQAHRRIQEVNVVKQVEEFRGERSEEHTSELQSRGH